MTDRTASPHPPGESVADAPQDAPREGTVYRGPGPRLRRAGRTAALLGVLLFIGLLTLLTSRYAHDFGPAPEDRDAAASPLAAVPLTAERIEELARRRLEEELRAAQAPPPPPELDLEVFGGEARAERRSQPGPPAPPAYAPPAAPRRAAPQRPALRSPLVPGTSGPVPRRQAEALAVPELPPLPDLSALRSAAGDLGPADRLAPPVSPESPRGLLPASPAPLDRRAFEAPSTAAAALVRVPPPAVPTLWAGTAVPLVLTHDVATDVPGPVRAVVARDVFDSVTGTRLLVPRGSLAIGHQAAHAAAGDERILLHWRELKLPSGASYRLPVLPAGSLDGTAGVRGDVDNHWWSRMGSAVALSLVAAGVQLSQPQERTAVQGLAPSEEKVLGRELGLELGRLSSAILRRGVNRPPTIHLRAGERLTLLVTRDLAFPR